MDILNTFLNVCNLGWEKTHFVNGKRKITAFIPPRIIYKEISDYDRAFGILYISNYL